MRIKRRKGIVDFPERGEFSESTKCDENDAQSVLLVYGEKCKMQFLEMGYSEQINFRV